MADQTELCLDCGTRHRVDEPHMAIVDMSVAFGAAALLDHALCVQDEIATLRTALAAATAERDAYRKAKQENDERFMRERDEARADLTAARALLRECLEWVWAVEGADVDVVRDLRARIEAHLEG